MDSWLRRRIRRSAQVSLSLWGAGAAVVLWAGAMGLHNLVADLNNRNMDHDGAYFVIALLLGCLGWCVWKLRTAVERLRDPAAHPSWRRVAQWGDPDALSAEIEREVSAALLKVGGWRFGPTYLVNPSGVQVLRWRDLLWAHKHVTSHSINFIPTGKTYRSMFYWMDTKIGVDGNQKKVDAALQCAAQRAPWAMLGYSKEIAKLYPRKKQELQAAVEQRYRQWEQQTRTASR